MSGSSEDHIKTNEIMINDLYKTVLLEHAASQDFFCNNKNSDNNDDWTYGKNPNCGDEYFVSIKINDGKVCDAKFYGEGCLISKASMNIVLSEIIGLSVDDCTKKIQTFFSMMSGAKDIEVDGDEKILKTIAKNPARTKCATLPWRIVQEVLETK